MATDVFLTSQAHGSATTGLTSAQISQQSNLVLRAYDRNAYFQYRPEAVLNMLAEVKPGVLTSPGSSVRFTRWNKMTDATTKLKEAVDVDAVGLSTKTVDVTPYEYGNAVISTMKLREDEFILNFDPDIAELIADNLIRTLEALAWAAWTNTTEMHSYVLGSTPAFFTNAAVSAYATAVNALDGDNANSRISMNAARAVVAKLRGDAVPTKVGPYYLGVMHPDVEYDLLTETGSGPGDTTWLSAAIRQAYPALERNTIGNFGGVAWSVSPFATPSVANSKDAYHTLVVGEQAYAKVESVPPSIIAGPVTDKLRRFRPIGWYTYMGWGRFRPESSWNIRSGASFGDNT